MTSIADRLDAARRDLLDLGLRNTLLNYRLPRSRGIQVVNAVPEEVIGRLIGEHRFVEFEPVGEGQLGLESTESSPERRAKFKLATPP
jgi:hypothetical protein